MKIAKELKKKGKVVIDGPKVKERKKSAPATQKHKAKKGKGSYDRNDSSINENIAMFLDSMCSKNYNDAAKYLQVVIESKLEACMAEEISTPLF